MCNFLVKRCARHYNAVQKKRLTSTAANDLARIRAAYYRKTGQRIETDIYSECIAVIDAEGLPERLDKPIATMKDFRDIVQEGVWGPRVKYRCARERLQVALFAALLVYTAARPAELALGKHQVDALKYKDVTFFLVLDRTSTEDNGEDLGLRQKIRLCCDVKLRNLKGLRLVPGS